MKILYGLWCAIVLTACSLECFRILQSVGYRLRRGYFKVFYGWYFVALCVLAAATVVWKYLLPLPYVLCTLYTVFGVAVALVKRKSPLKFTKRIWRMLAVQFVLLWALCWWHIDLWVLVLPLVTVCSWLVCLPVDSLINRKYLRAAQRKLQQSGLTVIAITGSYGKTSTKDMLHALLNDSIAPSGSCNTPLGIAKFINNTDFTDAKFLILEFGARQRGDIAQLCRLYQAHVGIVTGVCPQHMSTFKTFENVVATKCELVENLRADGFCVLADPSVQSFALVGACKKYTKIPITTSQCEINCSGMTFDAACGKQHHEVHLPQITFYSKQTFAICAFVCEKLGQKFFITVQNAQHVRQTPHRMEISHNGRFYIVDDSYNGNISGVAGCCKTLQVLCGDKIAIAQGIVECGRQRHQLNFLCGQLLGKVCKVVVVLGKNRNDLRIGAKIADCKVVVAKNLKNAVQLAGRYLSHNSILLFQNDLPDVAGI